MKTNDAANHQAQRKCLVACRVCVRVCGGKERTGRGRDVILVLVNGEGLPLDDISPTETKGGKRHDERNSALGLSLSLLSFVRVIRI